MATTTGIRIISTDSPTPQEQKHSIILDLWCDNTIEPEEESDRRRQALDLLRTVCKSWIHKSYVDEFNLPASDDVGGRIFTTGSYRYNAHSSGSDIDVVLIAPERLTLEHFKTKLPQILRALPAVSDMTVIGEARVPLIAMKIHGIDFDLSFGNVCRPRVPDDINMLDDRILIGLTPQSTKAANAVRVADLLIKSVPSVAVFRQVLRFVKVWAKARGVYSFKIGFPSGIGWAILCAKICQCYPNKNGAGTIFHFFAFFSAWFRRNPTPQNPNRAIFLTASHTPPVDLRREGVEPSWNPKERMKDARALFPVLTPAYPYQDSCDNVSMTTLNALCDEFHRAHETVRKLKDTTLDQIPQLQNSLQKALANKRDAESEATVSGGDAYERGKDAMKGASFGDLWETLLIRFPFFCKYTHYIRVTISASHPREYEPWCAMLEAKICQMWKESRINKGAALECWAPHLFIRPNNVLYEEPSQHAKLAEAKKALLQAEAAGNQQQVNNLIINQNVFSAYFYIGVRLAPGAKLATPQDQSGINFPKVIQAFTERCKDNQAKFTTAKAPVVEIVKRADLPSWLPGWKSEEEILKMEQQEKEELEQQQQQSGGADSSSSTSVLSSATTTKESGVVRERETNDDSNNAEILLQQRKKMMMEEQMKKQQEEQEIMKRKAAQEKEREAERLRKLQEEQQRKQQTEVESLMGFDF